jgi:hypothetical protein
MGVGLSVMVNNVANEDLANPIEAEIYERMGETTTYRLRYALDVVDNDYPLLKEATIGPESPLSIFVPDSVLPACLVKGPVYGQNVQIMAGGAESWVEVLGGDTTVAMNREEKVEVWSDVRDADVVTAVVSAYALLPDVESTSAVHAQLKHSLVQRDTDLRLVRRLARANGCLFWISTDPLGVETAHFKRPVLDGEPSVTLTVAAPETVRINWDVERATSTSSSQLDVGAKTVIDASVPATPLAPLGGQALSAVAPSVRSVLLTAPVDDLADLRARNEGRLIESGFFVKATYTTTFQAVQRVVRAHSLVDLQGIGSRHSGTYFCSAVRHVINEQEHRMDIELLRNGWLAE